MIVKFDAIELRHPDAGGGNVYFYKGEPFTGTIVEHINNVLVGEITVVEGHQNGRITSYYSNGQIRSEYFEKFNRMYNLYRRWNTNGVLEIEINYGPEPSLE